MSLSERARERIVVTGIGAVTPIGATWPEFRKNLWSDKSGIGEITRFDCANSPATWAGEVSEATESFPELSDETVAALGHVDVVRYKFFAAALAEALSSSRVNGAYAPSRIGASLGTSSNSCSILDLRWTYGSVRSASGEEAWLERAVREAVRNPVPPDYLVPDLLTQRILREHGCDGRTRTHIEACAASGMALAGAIDLIRGGVVDACITGGFDSLVNPLGLCVFAALGALSTSGQIRPFDRDRDGMLVGEGAAIFVVECRDAALRRGADILCELSAVGTSNDAFALTAPHPEGLGAARAMRSALGRAGLSPSEIDYINAHGTGTALNDPSETQAIRAVFGGHAQKVPISSTKPMYGHLIGASGAIEAMTAVAALMEGRVPRTLNHSTADPACDLDYVAEGHRELPLRHALSNSFGFGGVNASVVLSQPSL